MSICLCKTCTKCNDCCEWVTELILIGLKRNWKKELEV